MQVWQERLYASGPGYSTGMSCSDHHRSKAPRTPWQLARPVTTSCARALLLLMPIHAATPSDLNIGQAMMAPVRGPEQASPQVFPMEDFLDRLMAAESGGRLRSKNPRSTALGPFQFIESTFLFVANKHFKSEVAGLTEQQILARRTDMAFSRRAARAYVHDLMAVLASRGLPVSPVSVRIAFLVGPSAAVRLLGSRPNQPLASVLSADAIAANPFMSGATIADLVRKAAVEVDAAAETAQPGPPKDEPAVKPAALERQPTAILVALEAEPASTPDVPESEPAGTPVVSESEPAGTPSDQDEPIATTSAEQPLEIKCQIGLASCRRWIALRERRAALSARRLER